MDIEILQSKLKKGLSLIGRATSKSLSLPILKNILIKVENNFITLSATDLEIGVRWWTLVKTNKKGELTIPFNSFFSFVNLLPDKKISLKQKNNNLIINCEDYKTQINGLSSDDFPFIPQTEQKGKIVLGSNILCEGLSQIIDIPSLSKVKPEISGVLFSIESDILKLVATDSYRLAEKKVKINEKSKNNFSFILPQKTAKEIVNILKEVEKDVELIFGENQVLFKTVMDDFNKPEIEITSKIIEGNYPNYEAIIPDKLNTSIKLDKEDFLNKIKAASVFTSKINEVNLNISSKKEELFIKSSNNDLGNYETKIKGEVDGSDTSISFNYRFLLDGLINIKSSEVILKVNNDSNPGIIKPVGRDDFLYVVMPVKN